MKVLQLFVSVVFAFLLLSCERKRPAHRIAGPVRELGFPEELRAVLPQEENAFERLRGDSDRVRFLFRLAEKHPVHSISILNYIKDHCNDSVRFQHRLYAIKNIARTFYASNNVDSISYYCKLGLENAGANPRYREQQAEFYRLLGNLYSNFSRNVEAIQYFDRAIELASMSNNKDDFFRYVTEIGRVYIDMNEIEKACTCYLKGKEYAEKNSDLSLLVFSLNSIGDVRRMQNKYDEAIRYHELANEANRKKLGVEYEQWACTSLGKCYARLHQYDKARKYFNIGLRLASKRGSKDIITQSYLHLSRCDVDQNLMQDALLKANKAYEISQMIPQLDIKSAVAKNLFLCYEQTGNFVKALQFHKIYIQLKDSLENKENIRKFAETEYRLRENKLLNTIEQERQNLKFEQEKREQEKRRHLLITGSVTVVLLLSVCFAYYVFRTLQQIRAKNRIIEAKQSEILKSIRYASRIQGSFLPSEKMMEKLLKKARPDRGEAQA